MTTRTVDNKGRVSIGKELAGHLVIVKELVGGVLQIIPAEAVPAREAWLYRNPEAIVAVMEGLEQAKAGKFAEPPDLDADASLADTTGAA